MPHHHFRQGSLPLLCFVAVLALSQAGWTPPDTDHSAFFEAHEAKDDRAPTHALQKLIDAGMPVELEAATGQPTFLWLGEGWVDVPNNLKDPVSVARWVLGELGPLYRLTPDAIEGFEAHIAHDTGFGGIIVRFEQRINGVKVHTHRMNMLLERGSLTPVALSGHLFPGYTDWMPGERALDFDLDPEVIAAEAVVDRHGVGLDPTLFKATGRVHGEYTYYRLSPTGLRAIGREARVEPVRVKPVFYGLPSGLEAAYYLELISSEGEEALTTWGYVLSARDGRLLERTRLEADFDYTVWADPSDGWPLDSPQGSALTPTPEGATDALLLEFVDPTTISVPTGLNALEDPWLDPEATETLGNNVDAYLDLAAPDGFSEGDLRGAVSAPGIFGDIYDPTLAHNDNGSQQLAVVNSLFYLNNFLHDLFYDSGFDENAGNAQSDNYGRGGLGEDPILAQGQDFSGINNANMSTPADGASPRMQMFVFNRGGTVQVTLNDLTITQLGTAAFGPSNFDITAPVGLAVDGTDPVNDGCEPLVNGVEGQIVVVDRGGCTFVQKALNIQNAGGVGVLIVNNREGVGGMSGTEPLNIPSLMVPQDQRQALVDQLGQPVSMLRRFSSRSSGVDGMIVAHEWGHYLFGRLTSAGSLQSRGINEGNSDFVTLLVSVREEDTQSPGNDQWQGRFPVMIYSFNNALFGARRVPYSTDVGINGLNFSHISDDVPLPDTFPINRQGIAANNSAVHNTGEVWATMMWEVYVSLLQRHPFAEARARMLDYLVASLKMAPAAPTFTELRSATTAAMGADVEDFQAAWEAFSRRGIGMGAVAPPRNSNNNTGVEESFDLFPQVSAVSMQLTEGELNCDADGTLDSGELGLLQIELLNISPRVIENAVLTASADDVVVFVDGAEAPLPTLQPFARTTVALPVRLNTLDTLSTINLGFDVAFDEPGGPTLGTTSLDALVHFDEIANSTDTDTVDGPSTAWTVAFDAERAVPSGTADRVIFPEDQDNIAWHIPSGIGISDQYLISPPLVVSDQGDLVLSFTHTYQFESGGGTHFDAGVLELSTDGETWVDIGGSAAPGYNGTVTELGNGNANPLALREAFVDKNPSHPDSDDVTVNLGDVYQGQTVQIRFRVGTDPAASDEGWFIDDITLAGLDLPAFPTFVTSEAQCPNSPPLALAGDDLEVGSGFFAALDGTSSQDPWRQALGFAWTQIDGVAVTLDGGDTARPSFTAPVVFEDAALTFALVVTAEDGRESAPDEVVVIVRRDNTAPVADAGVDAEVDEGVALTLDGTGSSDAEDDPLTFIWSQIDGPTAQMSDADTASPQILAPEVLEDTALTFQLILSDGIALSEPATVEVLVLQVNKPPTADAGPFQTVEVGSSVTLDGSGSSDPDEDALTFAWTQTEGIEVTLDDVTAAQPGFEAPFVSDTETLRFSLVVSDGTLSSVAAEAVVQVLGDNRPPIADAGQAGSVDEGATFSLDGTNSSDPDGDALSFVWTQVAGPGVELQDPNAAVTEFKAAEVDGDTTLRFQLVVSDGSVLSEPATVEVLVLQVNKPPTADAGGDQAVEIGDGVTLDGGKSSDPDGDALTFVWSQVDGEPVELEDPNQAVVGFVAPAADNGERALVFELTVSDGSGARSTDTVIINVTPPTSVSTRGSNNGCAVTPGSSPGKAPWVLLGMVVLVAIRRAL